MDAATRLQFLALDPKETPHSPQEDPMAVERTFSIIKPDAVEKKKAGAILALLEEAGFSILACKRVHLTKEVAEGFYAVHKARPFHDAIARVRLRARARGRRGAIPQGDGRDRFEEGRSGHDPLSTARTSA